MPRLLKRAALGCAALAVIGCGGRSAPSPGPPAPVVAPPVNAAELVRALRGGGFVLFVRHAASAPGDDGARVVIEDCRTQRNLTAVGQAQAQAIHAALTRLRIPIGEVRASPYCRAADTARLAFGYMLLDNDLRPLRDGHSATHLAAVRHLLATPPVPGTNAVLVGHADTFAKLTGIELGEGDTAVVRPEPGGGSWTVVGRIAAAQWSALAIARAVAPSTESNRRAGAAAVATAPVSTAAAAREG
ncbi:MAG: histidine phosphatase family protein [Deltaproteobacteria bacterium]|nr:histidine phosphatase family protein [Deltaproteobacteria bacterium]